MFTKGNSMVEGVFMVFVSIWVSVAAWSASFPKRIDPSLHRWVMEYASDAYKYGYKADVDRLRYIGSVSFPETFMSDITGMGIPPHVLIDEKYINSKELLYHEMTHALFGCLGHLPMSDPSIMNDGPFVGDTYKLIRKLFVEDIPKLTCFRRTR